MDVVVTIGIQEQKLPALLTKMGYRVLSTSHDATITEALNEVLVDAIVWEDAQGSDDVEALYEIFRGTPSTKDAAIVYASTNDRTKKFRKLCESKGDTRFDIVSSPYAIGSLVTRLATQVRLRKLGGTAETSSLAETNAALRDLTDRFKRELDEAKNIQQSLLPPPLQHDERFTLSIYYSPLEGVGGDWYGIQKQKNGSIAIQVADVTGHGLAAAFLGSMTKLALYAADQEEPDKLFQKMNQLLAPQLPQGRFITVAGLSFDPDSGAFSYARAGHLPGLHMKYGFTPPQHDQIKAPGFAFGFFDDAEYEAAQGMLEPGDAFILTTDGITEGQNRKGDMFGMEGIIKCSEKCSADTTADELLKMIMTDFETFCGGRILKDDVTLLVLKRTKL